MGFDLYFSGSLDTKQTSLWDACLMSHPCFSWKTRFSSTVAFCSLLMHLHKMNILQLGCCNLVSLIMKVTLVPWWFHESGMCPSFSGVLPLTLCLFGVKLSSLYLIMLIFSESWNKHMFTTNTKKEKEKRSTRSCFNSKSAVEEYGAVHKGTIWTN